MESHGILQSHFVSSPLYLSSQDCFGKVQKRNGEERHKVQCKLCLKQFQYWKYGKGFSSQSHGREIAPYRRIVFAVVCVYWQWYSVLKERLWKIGGKDFGKVWIFLFSLYKLCIHSVSVAPAKATQIWLKSFPKFCQLNNRLIYSIL